MPTEHAEPAPTFVPAAGQATTARPDAADAATVVAVPDAGSSHPTSATATVSAPAPASVAAIRFGDYQLLGEAARGGMGVVYRARQVSLAQQALSSGETTRTPDLLAALRPSPGESDLRGFEWYCLWRQCHGEQATLRGHTGTVTALAFARDGRFLLTGIADETVKAWDQASGRAVATLPAPPRPAPRPGRFFGVFGGFRP